MLPVNRFLYVFHNKWDEHLESIVLNYSIDFFSLRPVSGLSPGGLDPNVQETVVEDNEVKHVAFVVGQTKTMLTAFYYLLS